MSEPVREFAPLDDPMFATATVNDAPLEVALEATANRAEQPGVADFPAEPAPPLAPRSEQPGN